MLPAHDGNFYWSEIISNKDTNPPPQTYLLHHSSSKIFRYLRNSDNDLESEKIKKANNLLLIKTQ